MKLIPIGNSSCPSENHIAGNCLYLLNHYKVSKIRLSTEDNIIWSVNGTKLKKFSKLNKFAEYICAKSSYIFNIDISIEDTFLTIIRADVDQVIVSGYIVDNAYITSSKKYHELWTKRRDMIEKAKSEGRL